MPFVAIDHTIAFAIDAAIKASHLQQIDQNIDDLNAARVTNGDSHDHGGGDGAQIPQGGIAASAVGQGQLKTTTGEVSRTYGAASNITLPGGTYGFYPQLKQNYDSGNFAVRIGSGSGIAGSYITNIHLDGTGASSGTGYAQQRYIQASPPYKIGDKLWGQFLFLLRKVTTGEVVSAYEAEDPPWAYNGAVYLPKDDPGRLAEVPHPFADYRQKDPAIDGLEIVLVDLTMRDVKKAKLDNAKLGKGLLEDIPSLIAGKGTAKAHADYLLPNIPRFSEQVKIYEP